MYALYLILNISSLSIPLIYSFNKKMNFIKHFKSISTAIIIVAIFYIVWDIWFTRIGVWGFNSDYYLGYTIFKIPFEEYLFFFCIPYASIFIHYSLLHFLPKAILGNKVTILISVLIIVISLVIFIYNLDKLYTSINFLILIFCISIGLILNRKLLSSFYISYLIILIPFILVNGILTGSFIEEPVVWYNNSENLGVRFGTIPIEDFGYAFSLLFFSTLIFEIIKKKNNHII